MYLCTLATPVASYNCILYIPHYRQYIRASTVCIFTQQNFKPTNDRYLSATIYINVMRHHILPRDSQILYKIWCDKLYCGVNYTHDYGL